MSIVAGQAATDRVPAAELAAIAAKQPSHLVVVPLDRSVSVSHRDSAPREWLKATDHARFVGKAQPGEFYVFQVAVVSSGAGQMLRIFARDLQGSGKPIDVRSIYQDGTGPNGGPHARLVPLKSEKVQSLWFSTQIPLEASGEYVGKIEFEGPPAFRRAEVEVRLTVEGEPLADHGDDDAWRLSRLRWLDSKIGQGGMVVHPFTAVRRSGQSLHVLGHTLRLQPNGLPAQLESHYTTGLRVGKETHPLLASPCSVSATIGGRPIRWQWFPAEFHTSRRGELWWRCQGTARDIRISVNGSVGFDGFIRYDVAIHAAKPTALDDFRLNVPYAKGAATYWCGLGVEGQARKDDLHWKWDVKKHQDALWLGSVNNGACWRFKGGNYQRPLVNIYYSLGPLASPDSWNNQGEGGVDVVERADSVLLTARSGRCRVLPRKPLTFTFEIRPTPVKPIDTDEHWATRYYHGDPEQALKDVKPGSYNTVNLHHASDINPFINYPYSAEAFPAFIDYVKKAHAKGLKAKVYYTTRELTQNLPELDALYSLDGEAIFPGPGAATRTLLHPNGPHQWLKDHFDDGYIPAWMQDLGGKFGKQYDLAVITTPESRWNNFYLEGLDYLARKAEIDGIYIDDSALDRLSLLRARRILEKRRPKPMIDLHSWNHFNEYAGYACNILMYSELLPFVDRIWFGEGFDYNRSPDYWLVEISGLPFGVMGEMLQDGGNPWRGMLYGMTNRLPWSGDPRPIWKEWDSFGMKGTTMLGYWDPACPIRTGRDDVLATVYRAKGRALVSIASWAKEPVSVRLSVDWKGLGLDPARAQWRAPAIAGFQEERVFAAGEPVPVPPGKGWLIEVVER